MKNRILAMSTFSTKTISSDMYFHTYLINLCDLYDISKKMLMDFNSYKLKYNAHRNYG